jgi:hypothetical protein
VSRRNIWDASATPSGMEREWYVCMYVFVVYFLYFDEQFGAVVRIVAYYVGRGFDPSTKHELICLYWVWVFLGINRYVFKEKYMSL